MKLAIFDLDHTLIPLDSDYNWVEFLIRHGHVGSEAKARNEELMHQYNAGTLDPYVSIGFMLSLIANRPRVQLDAWHAQYMQEVIEPVILPSALALLEAHKSAGYTCLIATATNEFVTQPIGAALGVAHLVGTVPQVTNGMFTGQVEGTPCFKEGKITRVGQWLAAQGLAWTDVTNSVFYSDSVNDIPLLAHVKRAVATNPSATLRQHAYQQGWTVLDLFH